MTNTGYSDDITGSLKARSSVSLVYYLFDILELKYLAPSRQKSEQSGVEFHFRSSIKDEPILDAWILHFLHGAISVKRFCVPISLQYSGNLKKVGEPI